MYIWYIYPHEWLFFYGKLGKYHSPLDPMGVGKSSVTFFPSGLLLLGMVHQLMLGRLQASMEPNSSNR